MDFDINSSMIHHNLDSTNNLRSSHYTLGADRGKESALDQIEDKWESLLKNFDLHLTAADGRIQSGKVYTQASKIQKKNGKIDKHKRPL